MIMAKASARHILVDSEDQCASLKQQIEDGADFAEVAKETFKLSHLVVAAETWVNLAQGKW